MMDCTVYWIHLPEHTDILSQGYVGITTHSVSKRFAEHITLAKSGKGHTVGKAIRKYGDNVLIDVILKSSKQACLKVESKFRPSANIAWNYAAGGGGNHSLKHTDATKKKISEAILRAFAVKPQTGHAVSEATKLKQHLAKVGKPVSDKMRAGFKAYAEKLESWTTNNADKQFWIRAVEFYEFWSKDKTVGNRTMGKQFNTTHSKFLVIVKKFKNNWNPVTDPKWTEWASKINSL